MIWRDTMLNNHGKDTYGSSVCLLPGGGKWGEPAEGRAGLAELTASLFKLCVLCD